MDPSSPQSEQRQQQPETPSTTLFVSGLDPEMGDGDFSSIFQSCQGVVGTRTKPDKKGNLIGFVDFDTEDNAIAVRTRFDNGKFPGLSNGNYDVHYARPTRNRQGADNVANRSPRSNNGPRRNNNNQGGGFGDFSRGGGGGGGGRNNSQGNNNNSNSNMGYGNYNSMAYGGPYSGMSGVGNAVLPSNASSTLYVEGVAHDATDREVSHIFRPFPGFQTVRTFTRESRKYPDSTYLLCFVEFDNPHLATNAMQMLQGYKFDLNKKDGSRGLRISYAANNTKQNRGGGGGNGGGRRGGGGDDGNNNDDQRDQDDRQF